MEITLDKRLFWFLKDSAKLNLSNSGELDIYIQQTITQGRTNDIKDLFKIITPEKFKESFLRIRIFLPFEVRKFWEDTIGII